MITTRPFQLFLCLNSCLIDLVAFSWKSTLRSRRSIIRLPDCFSPALSVCSMVYLPSFSIFYISHGEPSMVMSGVLAPFVRFGHRKTTCFLGILFMTKIFTTSISRSEGRAPSSSSIVILLIRYILPRS